MAILTVGVIRFLKRVDSVEIIETLIGEIVEGVKGSWKIVPQKKIGVSIENSLNRSRNYRLTGEFGGLQ